jgi:hypothetical protein
VGQLVLLYHIKTVGVMNKQKGAFRQHLILKQKLKQKNRLTLTIQRQIKVTIDYEI